MDDWVVCDRKDIKDYEESKEAQKTPKVRRISDIQTDDEISYRRLASFLCEHPKV